MEFSKIWLCAFLMYHIAGTDAVCNCPTRHPQTKYCQADYVIEGTVTDAVALSAIPYTYKIELQLGTIHKLTNGASNALQGTLVNVFSTINDCALAYMVLNENYFITGGIRHSMNRAYSNLCEFVEQSSTMTAMQILGMQSEYKKGCSCKIVNCWNDYQCNAQLSPNVCRIDRRKSPQCHDLYGVCKRNSNGVCKWNTNYVPLTDCIALQ